MVLDETSTCRHSWTIQQISDIFETYVLLTIFEAVSSWNLHMYYFDKQNKDFMVSGKNNLSKKISQLLDFYEDLGVILVK